MGRLQTGGFWRSRRNCSLSYSAPIRLAANMHRPDRTELEFTMLLFAGLVPVGYYTVRSVMGLL
jgi:hypothetical protein